MTRSSLSLCKRILAPVQSASILLLLLILSGLGTHLSATALQAPVRGPKIWLGDNQAVPVNSVGTVALAQNVASGQAQALSMATADVDGDGVADMVAGFSASGGGAIVIHRGNLDAFAPQSDASFQAIAHGQFPAPFLPNAQVVSIPVRPDFMALGRFTSGGRQDLVVAALGGNSLYLFPGDGKGSFGAPQTIALSGGVTAMAAENLLRSLPYSNLVVGVATPRSSSLLVFSGSDSGLTPPAVFPLKAAVSNIVFGDFGDSNTDTAFLSGGNLFILHSSNFQMEALSLPVNASAMALGSFIFDRAGSLQIALLTSDGSLHIAAHAEFDPRPLTGDEFQARLHAARRGYGNPLDLPRTLPQNGFKIVESIAAAAPFAAGQMPVLFRTRISDHGADDVMVLNPSAGQLAVISHPDVAPGATTFLPAEISTRPYSGSPVAALPMRTNIDGRPGVVALHAGQLAPAVMMPLPDPTFIVNTTADGVNPGACAAATPNQCTLREAILEANAAPGTDTITVPAGTYTLTLPRVQNDCTGLHGALSVNDSVNIVGAGQATTIIQAGTTNTNGIDMVMNVNEDLATANCLVTNATASISNLTMQFGRNHGAVATFDGDGGCMEFDTGSSGNATLTMDHVTLTNCSTTDGNGGGIATFNVTAPGGGTGLATITNSIFQNSAVAEVNTNAAGSGGAIWVSDLARMSMSNSQILNNNANQINGTGRGVGGGLFIFSAGSGSRQTVLHSNTITGNNASGDGGGIWSTSNLSIDNAGTPTSLTVISGNTAGGNGGGIHYHAVSPDVMTLSKVTITGNTATGAGGGIDSGEPTLAHAFSMSFSRVAGNTAATAKNLNNNHSTATVTNNWWGTDAPATTIANVSGGTTTFDPFVVLTNTTVSPAPAKIRINQSTTLTGDMSKDNHGSGAALTGNLDVIVGLPITFTSGPLGTIPQAQPETLNASAQATATFNAGGTSGRANPTAAVDQAGALANDSLIASATEATSTVTITTVGAHGFSTGQTAVISGVTVGGYNGTFIITATPTTTAFTYTDPTTGLGASSGGTANVGIVILEPPQITKSFGAATIPVNGTTTVNFSINNPNVVAINGSFTDTLPIGLQVAATPGVTNTCGGTVTAVAGSGSISFSNNLTPVGVCTISVNITGTIDNNYTNSVQILSTDAGNGNTSSANLTVINPPSITKAFGAATIPLNGTTSLTFTLSSTNQNLTITGAAFTDNLPAGLVVATPPNTSGSCTGTGTAVAGASSISLSGQTLAPNASCTVVVNVQGTTAGVKNNSVQVTSTNAGTGNTSNASITVVAPPVIIKAFGAASIPLNGSSSLTFTIQNNNTTVALTGVAFTDTLPAGLVISTPNGLTGTCGAGTITATQATNVISLSGGTIAASGSCTFSVNVTGIAAGLQTNTTGNVTSTEGGTGGTATASVKVEAPPSIAKVFNPSTIALNATTSLTFTITNPAANVDPLTGVAFTDTLPTGLVVSTPNGLSNTCGGTATAVAGSTSISLTGGSIAVNTNCTLVVNVTGTTSGQYTNTTGAVSSTNGGTGNTASANLTVATPPTITKVFGAASIPLNGTTSLTFTIQNPNTTLTLNGIAFTDNLPAGLLVATPNALNNTCGGTATAVAGSGSISLSGGTLASSASCTVSVNVQGTTAGVKNNSVQVTSTEGGTGNTSNASITVVAPPVIIKAFGAASIPLNGSTSLTFTIQNNNTTTALTGVGFSDTLPAGLVISTPNGLTGSCGGGTITATQATNVISLSGATLAASTSCTFAVNVTGIAAGTQNNTTGNVTSTEGGTGGTASASINVVAPPSIAKVFNPSSIALNATTSLTFTITNPAANTVALTGVAFTDTLPTGLTVANASATVCGGTLTATAPTGIALSGATINANSQCQFSVTVTGAAAGQYTNTTGNVTSTNGGAGNTASANLTVGTPPTITKAFGAASILLNANTSLTFNITNPNTNLALTGVAFTDALPAGLAVATPNGLSSTCGGTATAAAGSGSISLSGGTLAANGSCTISLNVTGTQAGVQNNTTGPISSNESGAGATSNTASITVIGPPSISKAFGAASIQLNAQTTLTFTITNPNATVALTGVGFGDTLPAGLAVANPNGLTGSCGSGTITTGTVSGFSVVNLSGGTIAAGGSCTFSVNVVGVTGGHKVNTTGTVTSSNAGSGNQATATIDVEAPDPTIIKTHSGTFNRGQQGAQWTITVSNVGFGPTVGTVTVTDTLPNVQNPPVPTAITGTGWTCTLATLTCTRADALPSGSSYPPITLTVNIPQNIQNNFTNTAMVSGGGDVNLNNNTATDKISLGPPIVITAQTNSSTVKAGSAAQFTFNVEDDDPSLGMVTFGCSGLPVGTSCVFNPPATNQPLTVVTMTVTTSSDKSAVAGLNFDFGGKPPLYAALFFPVVGLVGIALSGRKARKTRLRFAMVFVGAAMLLSFAGCAGGLHGPVTPAGTYQITVTAASATVQASTPVTLSVQ
ncbi:MAG TPA: CSLREA domain-containing protein [Candidatus Angelobacter sp.]|nr:CSLREA domain-containing protein [Candidatus Angelobacter sp.]